ncbi:uncharacterized protein K02A2.6-like [Centruroides sculpturatus]|uniref:uncharacterized protein K02A2.6-like n=1 Tax=Centruroides sculpturatus TaxID=218467 RepID=UPI000C6CC0B0|nr:uncharacterized protein K02A2.6-like [Centruroides sculpturatus]
MTNKNSVKNKKCHKYGNCPAFGKFCYKCKKKNHFSSACKVKKINEIDNPNSIVISDEEDYLLDRIIVLNELMHEHWEEVIEINGNPTKIKLDTGVDTNVISWTYLKQWTNSPKIKQTKVKAYTFTRERIPIVSECHCQHKSGNHETTSKFLVVRTCGLPLLNRDACKKLNLIKRINSITPELNQENIFESYSSVFEGSGKLKHEVIIKLNQNAIPKLVSPRRIPEALKREVKQELEHLVRKGILKKTEETSSWLHPMVIIKKKQGKLRLCMDLHELNKYIIRDNYQIPSPTELLSSIPKDRYYTVMDAKSAFFQLLVEEQSQKLLIMNTHFGKYKFTRLPFGITTASEHFQRAIDTTLSDIEGIYTYSGTSGYEINPFRN